MHPNGEGTKAARWHQRTVAAGDTIELRFRLSPTLRGFGGDFDATMADRRAEADEHYAAVLARPRH